VKKDPLRDSKEHDTAREKLPVEEERDTAREKLVVEEENVSLSDPVEETNESSQDAVSNGEDVVDREIGVAPARFSECVHNCVDFLEDAACVSMCQYLNVTSSEKSTQNYDAVLLGLLLLTFMTAYYLVNSKLEVVQTQAWDLIVNSTAIFVAVFSYVSVNDLFRLGFGLIKNSESKQEEGAEAAVSVHSLVCSLAFHRALRGDCTFAQHQSKEQASLEALGHNRRSHAWICSH
jgi:hypothetical protein